MSAADWLANTAPADLNLNAFARVDWDGGHRRLGGTAMAGLPQRNPGTHLPPPPLVLRGGLSDECHNTDPDPARRRDVWAYLLDHDANYPGANEAPPWRRAAGLEEKMPGGGPGTNEPAMSDLPQRVRTTQAALDSDGADEAAAHEAVDDELDDATYDD